ncbi:calcium-activated chloride channel-domain-containing protein [Lipomyces tetrasporus]
MSWLAGQEKHGHDESDNLGVDWVLQYEFGDIDQTQAVSEFRTLIHDLTEAGLRVQVHHGHGSALLVCIRVPRDHLGKMVHQSRIKDWLFGIIHTLPSGDENTIASAETPAEEIRSIYHAVTWQKDLGGAGITPEFGKWKNITASFPLHDRDACSELLSKWNRKTNLNVEDLDTIRALFGEKVAFYFAFIHCYSLFLVVPAAMGIVGWWFLGPYSIIYGSALVIWCIVFVEFWKIRESDLSVRWNVKGVGQLKVNRSQYQWEREVKDPISGQVTHTFPGWKQFLRQMLLVPFASVASVALGTLIVVTFASEVFISEVYNGPLKGYLEFVPTILFSLSLPAITSFLTGIATRLTDYENYRTQDLYDLAQTQKTFVMHFITSFLPTILTAYVYVPFGHAIVPHLDILRRAGINTASHKDFEVDTSRFQAEIIYLSMTAQVFSFAEEIVLPYVKHVLWQKWRNYRDRKAGLTRQRSFSKATDLLLIDAPEESSFLRRVRAEADADEYKVEEDILEMCVQFGYLALFGVAWPLVPLGFLLNNWLEVRGDFFKLTLECQRPPPIRADSIGPCLLGLDFLAWMGTLSTAAIVYLYRGPMSEVRLASLLLTVFIAEQVYLGIRFTASTALQKIFSDTLRREEASRYAVRKTFLEMNQSRHGSPDSPSRVRQRVRFHERVNVYSSDTASADGSPSPTNEQPQDEVLRGSDREAEFGRLGSAIRLMRASS